MASFNPSEPNFSETYERADFEQIQLENVSPLEFTSAGTDVPLDIANNRALNDPMRPNAPPGLHAQFASDLHTRVKGVVQSLPEHGQEWPRCKLAGQMRARYAMQHSISSNPRPYLGRLSEFQTQLHCLRRFHGSRPPNSDAWHYIGHLATDLLCRLWCNLQPTNGSQPDLICAEQDANGTMHQTRAFNTETAEQLNSWLNGFESQLRQMSDVNYDFYVHVIIYSERIQKRVEEKDLELTTEEFWIHALGN
ncbi:hypothetical protein DFH09DRAFT_1068706 [Mycena vulgaris]|nr:hypothetical protein DFH09DRAFT_1068706 [Mycena vulgaris]